MELKRIESDELRETTIALWATECGFEELRHKPLPTPPALVQNYCRKPLGERKHMNQQPSHYKEFWFEPAVVRYFETCAKLQAENNHNEKWLGWIESKLAAYPIEQRRVRERRANFKSLQKAPIEAWEE